MHECVSTFVTKNTADTMAAMGGKNNKVAVDPRLDSISAGTSRFDDIFRKVFMLLVHHCPRQVYDGVEMRCLASASCSLTGHSHPSSPCPCHRRVRLLTSPSISCWFVNHIFLSLYLRTVTYLYLRIKPIDY